MAPGDPTRFVEGPQVQDLAASRLPPGFRGRSAAYVQLWWIAQAVLVHTSPQLLYGWRRMILRLFGARIGKNVKIRPSVRITYPWKVEIGDHSWIGDGVELYSLGPIRIGSNAVVSQYSYLCAGTHDHHDRLFTIKGMPITVGDEAWVAAHSFIAPGVTIGSGAVVGARSVVLQDIPDNMLAAGHPARVRGQRNPRPA
jgi:putative colanic acid biosynthesis acetyltransferase WcaF